MTSEKESGDDLAGEEDDRPIELDALDVLLSSAMKSRDSQDEFFAALNAARARKSAATAPGIAVLSPIFVPSDRLAAISSCEYVDSIIADLFDLVLSGEERDSVASGLAAANGNVEPWLHMRRRTASTPEFAIERFGAMVSTHVSRAWDWFFPKRPKDKLVIAALEEMRRAPPKLSGESAERSCVELRAKWYRFALNCIRQEVRQAIGRPLTAKIPIQFVGSDRPDIFVARPEFPRFEEAGYTVYSLAKSALRRVMEEFADARRNGLVNESEDRRRGALESFAFTRSPKSLTVTLMTARQYFFREIPRELDQDAYVGPFLRRIQDEIARLRVAASERPITMLDVEWLLEMGTHGGGRYAEDAANLLGFIHYCGGKLDRATQLLQRVIGRAGTDKYGLETLAYAMSNLSAVQVARGDHSGAILLGERALLLKRHLEDGGLSDCCNLLCFWLMHESTFGDERAEHYLAQLLAAKAGVDWFVKKVWTSQGQNALVDGLIRTGLDRCLAGIPMPPALADSSPRDNAQLDIQPFEEVASHNL